MFLRFSWLPHYHILQIFKVDTKFPWETSDEFLVSADTDQSELMLEIRGTLATSGWLRLAQSDNEYMFAQNQRSALLT